MLFPLFKVCRYDFTLMIKRAQIQPIKKPLHGFPRSGVIDESIVELDGRVVRTTLESVEYRYQDNRADK